MDGWMDTCERAEDQLVDLSLCRGLEGGAGRVQQLHPGRANNSKHANKLYVYICVCVLVSLTPAGWWDRVAAGWRWSRTSRVGRWCWLWRKAVCSGSRSAGQRLVRWSDWLCQTPAAETPPARGTGEPRPASDRHRPQPIRTQTHLRQPIRTQMFHKWPIRTLMLHK